MPSPIKLALIGVLIGGYSFGIPGAISGAIIGGFFGVVAVGLEVSL